MTKTMTYKAEIRREMEIVLRGRDGPPVWVKSALFEIVWCLGNFHPKIIRAKFRLMCIKIKWFGLVLILGYFRMCHSIKREVIMVRLFVRYRLGL